jgi:hypothetical protein
MQPISNQAPNSFQQARRLPLHAPVNFSHSPSSSSSLATHIHTTNVHRPQNLISQMQPSKLFAPLRSCRRYLVTSHLPLRGTDLFADIGIYKAFFFFFWFIIGLFVSAMRIVSKKPICAVSTHDRYVNCAIF